MARIAFCLPALPSHAAVHGTLARALAARGHDCHFVGAAGLAPLAAREGVAFAGFAAAEMDMTNAGLLRTLWAAAAATGNWCRNGPEALARLAPDLVVADQAEPGGSLAAEAARLPRATFAVALPLDRTEAIPPPFVGWPMLDGPEGRKRNRGGWRVADALLLAQSRRLAAGCRAHGLALRTRLSDWISSDLDLRQVVPSLDFPHPLGSGARPVGPVRDGPAETWDFADDGRPVVFASLGTLQGGRTGLLETICAAAADLGAHLALAHAGALDDGQVARLPGRPSVRRAWPQRAVLRHAAACVTHAGMNTVLDCAAAGVPMVAIPLAFEQPATAARLAHHGIGRVIPPRRANRAAIRAALADVLGDARLREALRPVAAEMAAAGGTARAADLVEAHLAGRAGAGGTRRVAAS